MDTKVAKEGKGIYSAKPEDHLFDDRSSEYLDHYNPFKVLLASTPYRREGKRKLSVKPKGITALGKPTIGLHTPADKSL